MVLGVGVGGLHRQNDCIASSVQTGLKKCHRHSQTNRMFIPSTHIESLRPYQKINDARIHLTND